MQQYFLVIDATVLCIDAAALPDYRRYCTLCIVAIVLSVLMLQHSLIIDATVLSVLLL